MNTRSKIIFINQSSELYGSDKTLLDLVIGLKNHHHIDPIVIMQNPGILSQELDKHDIEYHFIPVLKLHKNMFRVGYLWHLLKNSVLAPLKLHKIVKQHNVKLIYSNAFSVMLGNAYAFWFKKHHIWHCHEIILSPKLFLRIYNLILKSKLVDDVIYNSKTTMENWVKNEPKLTSKAHLIYNGIDLDNPNLQPKDIHKLKLDLFPDANHETIIFGNIGRFSERKGVDLLIEAFRSINHQNPNSKLLFVGSPAPGKEDFLNEMQEKIKAYNLIPHVKFVSFVMNVFPYWHMIDIGVLPTKEPESFGLVALEAMLVKKPLIVADHGGMAEIVIHQETGLKFKPNDLSDLIQKMEELSKHKDTWSIFGENAYHRVHQNFNLSNYINGIAAVCNKFLK